MLFDVILLYLSIALILFLPGYFLMLAILGKKKSSISLLEQLIITFGLSLVATTFLVILMNFSSIPITRLWILTIILSFSAICFLVYKRRMKEPPETSNKIRSSDPELGSILRPSYRQIIIFILILVFAVAVRGFYISRGIMPQTTDMGHHMYWANFITQNGNLPEYGTPDFIIGEHIIFAAISILSGISFISAMPVIILLLVNIFSLLAVFILSSRLSESFTSKRKAFSIGLFSMLIMGTFYAISSPGAKFISGGVIGNIVGNFLIPLSLYFFFMATKEKSRSFAMLFLVSFTALIYTHHLSTLIFLYIFAGFILALLITLLIYYRFNLSRFFSTLWIHLAPFLAPRNLLLISFFVLLAIFIWTPSYLNPQAIDTGVGTPSKATRTGLSLGAIILNVGPWTFFYGIIGIIFALSLLWFTLKKGSIEKKGSAIIKITSLSLLLAWTFMIVLMSTRPDLLKIDIPSNRIVSYLSCPFTILAALGAFLILWKSRIKLSYSLFTLVFILIIGTGFISGLADISESARAPRNNKEVMQTYVAAMYLAEKTAINEMVLKDHINLSGDTWMKIFFMRGYKFPLSRTYDRRYEDPTKDRETCTRDMVRIPDSEIGQNCFNETKTKYVVLKDGSDTGQFEKSDNFSKVYASSSVVIFQRNP